MDPAACSHCQACWSPGPLGLWSYGCRTCGLRATGVTLDAAKTLFGLRAERVKIEAIKRKAPEEMTDADWTWLAYSPFGSGSWCGY